MGLIKWIKRELDSSNSCKRRQSEPPLSGNSSQLPRDESYVKALSKFNEWRQRQIFGGTARLSRKQSRKLAERCAQSDTLFQNRNVPNDKEVLLKNVTTIDNSLYEEIQVKNLEQQNENDLSTTPARNTIDIVPIRHSYPTTDIARAKARRNSSLRQAHGIQIYENTLVELVNQFDRSPDILNISKQIVSPPVKFFKENSNPFANVRTPIRRQEIENSSDAWIYESPSDRRALDVLRSTFEPFKADEAIRDSISSNGKTDRNPPYQTVINKHGDEVEYALPLNEKPDDDEDDDKEGYCLEGSKARNCRIVALNNTSSYQQYVDDNFQFLNEKERLGVSPMSVSFSRNQSHRANVIITDLDKTNGTKATDDQNNSKEPDIIQELEALQVWSRNLSENLENNFVQKKQTNMHFAEIIVCKSNEVTEKDPREIFDTLNGTLHLGTFHCVPVTQFKPHRRDHLYGDSALQLNYEVLRKIRHPDVALLMGITVDNKCAIDSLILEPLNYTLNYFIHKEGGCIPTSVCLLYTLQITNAVTYLHKHGLVHSNISTHSIVMCPLSKAVKLTSFELTTNLNGDLRDELAAVLQNENQQLNNVNVTQLPYKLLPYNIHYRKSFSKQNYQAPELLSKQFPFVFPKIQCDVYGICLTLWEMINCSKPFADFDYDEMMKLIYLQNPQLPTLRPERQKPFESVLHLGLNVIAENRISDTIELNEALNEISLGSDAPNGEQEILSINETNGIPTLLNSKAFGPMVYERTSTIKKRKSVLGGENRLTARQLFVYSQMEKPREPIPSHTSSPNSPRYGFEIGEVSIPETPIARSNKLRKTAWLSNQSISPIVHLEIKSKDDDATINQIQIVENKIPNAVLFDDTSTNKLYNVNIRIRPNSKKSITPNKTDQSLAEDSSPGQPQKNSSNISDHIKFFNLVSKSSPQLSQAKIPSPVENNLNYNKNVTKPTPITDKILNHKPESVVSQKGINDFLSRSQPMADFESSLWRREKQKCDQSVRSQRRVSVKDAVNKFESFSKSMLSESNSPKSRRVTSSSDERKKSPPDLDCPTNDMNSEKNVSKLNVILRSKSDDSQYEALKKSETNSNCCTIPSELKQSPMLTLNFKKLDRRASDIGSYFICQNPTTKALTARHSIYGTEIFKRLRKAQSSVENKSEDLKDSKKEKKAFDFDGKKNNFKIKVGNLTCLNCGHKLFVVDDVVPSNTDEDINEGFTKLLLTPLARNLGIQVTKSTEDFYIDDDFCEDIELCANMELGTRSHLSDLIDFDILSAEIFNPTNEIANQNT